MNHATMIIIALLLAAAGFSPVFAQPGTEMSPEDMQEKWAESMMLAQAFEGLGYTGYDNYKNLYVSTWMDNMSTSLSTSKGQRDPATGVFTFYGEMDEPMLSVHGRMVKMVMRPHGSDAHVFEMFDLHAGDDDKVMEITYRKSESSR